MWPLVPSIVTFSVPELSASRPSSTRTKLRDAFPVCQMLRILCGHGGRGGSFHREKGCIRPSRSVLVPSPMTVQFVRARESARKAFVASRSSSVRLEMARRRSGTRLGVAGEAFEDLLRGAGEGEIGTALDALEVEDGAGSSQTSRTSCSPPARGRGSPATSSVMQTATSARTRGGGRSARSAAAVIVGDDVLGDGARAARAKRMPRRPRARPARACEDPGGHQQPDGLGFEHSDPSQYAPAGSTSLGWPASSGTSASRNSEVRVKAWAQGSPEKPSETI